MPSFDDPEAIGRIIEGVMDPRVGGEKVMEMLLPYLHDIYTDLDAATEGADLLLTHPLPLLGPIVAQEETTALGVEHFGAGVISFRLRSGGPAAVALVVSRDATQPLGRPRGNGAGETQAR